MQLKSVLEESRRFFASHDLGVLAKELPVSTALSEAGRKRFEQASQEGFDCSMAFPSVATQKVHFDAILRQTATAPAFGLSKAEQYTPPYLQEMQLLRSAPVRGRPLASYLLLYKSASLPRETRAKGANDLDALFASLGWQGLTVTEYLVLQRVLCEKNGDHRFDIYAQDVARSQWMWLLDSRPESGAVTAYWNPRACRIELGVGKEGQANERRGAHPTIVISLG